MPHRKFVPNRSRTKERFTPGDIVRVAIESVEATGLVALSVEITPTGAIKISSGPRQKAPTSANRPDEAT